MVTPERKTKDRLSISIEPTLIALVDEIVQETHTNRSYVISRCLEELAQKRKENSMIAYYEDMAKEDEEFINSSVKVIQSIASSWSD